MSAEDYGWPGRAMQQAVDAAQRVVEAAMTMPSTAPRRAYTGAQSQWLNALDAFYGIIRPTRPRRAAR